MTSEIRGGTETNPAPVVATHAVPKLVATSGPSAGRAFAVTRATSTVGRHPTNDFVLDDPRLSGAHLELTRVGDRVRVLDIGSTNGTWIGPHRVIDVELAAGAEITVGETVLRLGTDDSVAPPAPVAPRDAFGELVGRSAVMRELFVTLERIAPKDLAVLVQGEIGSGKEAVARAIHAASTRAAGPFLVVDATSVSAQVAELLLFGQEKEAAGGAEARPGVFEAASGGTVFIEEIGELTPALQATLLRVLERREVVRVGGTAPVPIDVRVLSSAKGDLRNAIDRGHFREELYLRLAQVRVFVPPLRQRLEDLPLLGAKLLSRTGAEVQIDQEALDHLATLRWPGNVRELENAVLRAAALSQDGVIRRQDVAGEGEGFRGTGNENAALDLTGTFGDAKERAIERFERAYLALLMRRCQGNLSAAARQADVARHHLRDLLKKRGLYGVSLDEDIG